MKKIVALMASLLFLSACGSMMKGLNSIRDMGEGMFNQEIRSDLNDRPYMAKAFKADKQKMADALKSVLEAKKMKVKRVEKTDKGDFRVHLSPSKVKKLKGNTYMVSMMDAWVRTVDEKNVVSLRFMEGKSFSQLSIDTTNPQTPGSGGFPNPEVKKGESHYSNIIELVGKKL